LRVGFQFFGGGEFASDKPALSEDFSHKVGDVEKSFAFFAIVKREEGDSRGLLLRETLVVAKYEEVNPLP